MIRDGGVKKKSCKKEKGMSKERKKVPPPSKKENITKDEECFHYGKMLYICNNVHRMRSSMRPEKDAMVLHIGNGNHVDVEAIGSYFLNVPSGMKFCIDQCHYSPTITRGVIFVSRLRDADFELAFMHYGNRAKDLLGLVLSDVCGPFRTQTREGNSYFVTFTNDFSRYGYVYLIKHKHEVFKTFVTYQHQVENQLDKKIKILRSDREGGYLSQEFIDHLAECEIISQRTPPYTPQHNGESERGNQNLLDMVRSMMNLNDLSLSFWRYSLETVASILNMVPTKKVQKTPYERWHGKAPKILS
nr:retrotransposon protein, putative, Ty1-copia subclass [Tanacetum cinerariifolium]